MKMAAKPWYEHLSMFLYCAMLLLLTFCVLVSELTESDPYIQDEVYKVSGGTDTLQTYSNVAILGAQKINISKVSFAMKYLAPRPHIDPLYASLFFLSAVIIVVFFRDFSYKNPFTKKALYGLYTSVALILIFYVINFLRYDWFNNQVLLLTQGQFNYNKPFPLASPEFWILLILIRLIRIFKRGVGLQNDVDLTV